MHWHTQSPVIQCALLLVLVLGHLDPRSRAIASDVAEIEARALVAERSGDIASAIELREQVLNEKRKVVGDDHWQTKEAVENLEALRVVHRAGAASEQAFVELRQLEMEYKRLYGRGKDAEAVEVALAARDLAQRFVGRNRRVFAAACYSAGRACARLEQDAQARPLLQEAIAVQNLVFQGRHPMLANTLTILGEVQLHQEDFNGAEASFLQSLSVYESTIGREHTRYGLTLQRLGNVYAKTKRLALAIDQYEAAADVHRSATGTNSVYHGVTMTNLGAVMRAAGRPRDAVAAYEQATHELESSVGKGHPLYAGSLLMLGSVYHEIGDYRRAETVQLSAVAACRQAYGDGSLFHAASIYNLGRLYHQAGDMTAAEPFLLDAKAKFAKCVGEHSVVSVNCASALGALYCDRGELDRAKALVEQVEAAFDNANRTTDLPAAFLEDRANYHRLLKDYSQAEELLTRALQQRVEAQGESHPSYASCLCVLGELRIEQGNVEEAERLIIRALALSETALGVNHPQVGRCLAAQAACLRATGRMIEAAGAIQRAEQIRAKTRLNAARQTSEKRR